MRRFRPVLLFVLPLAAAVAAMVSPGLQPESMPAGAQAAEAPVITTIYIVRHAEKDENERGGDPALSQAGADRAAALARVLRDAPITHAYCTMYQRTRQTAQPTADAFGLAEVTQYGPFDAPGVARRALEDCRGKAGLIVGHSNTVGRIVEALGGGEDALRAIGENDYDHLFVVDVIECGGGGPGEGRTVAVNHLHYGA